MDLSSFLAGLYCAFYLCVMACYSVISVPYNGLIADQTPPSQRGDFPVHKHIQLLWGRYSHTRYPQTHSTLSRHFSEEATSINTTYVVCFPSSEHRNVVLSPVFTCVFNAIFEASSKSVLLYPRRMLCREASRGLERKSTYLHITYN